MRRLLVAKTLLLVLPGISCSLVLPPSFNGFWAVLGIQNIIPPSEAARIVTDEFLVVKIMVVSARPEWQEMMETPRELVAAVSVDSLEQPQYNPNVHGENVEVTGYCTPEDRAANSTETENHNFDRRSIFSCHAKGGRILVVDLVNSLVKGTPMKCSVREVVPCILKHKEDCNLVGHCPKGGERNRC